MKTRSASRLEAAQNAATQIAPTRAKLRRNTRRRLLTLNGSLFSRRTKARGKTAKCHVLQTLTFDGNTSAVPSGPIDLKCYESMESTPARTHDVTLAIQREDTRHTPTPILNNIVFYIRRASFKRAAAAAAHNRDVLEPVAHVERWDLSSPHQADYSVDELRRALAELMATLVATYLFETVTNPHEFITVNVYSWPADLYTSDVIDDMMFHIGYIAPFANVIVRHNAK